MRSSTPSTCAVQHTNRLTNMRRTEARTGTDYLRLANPLRSAQSGYFSNRKIEQNWQLQINHKDSDDRRYPLARTRIFCAHRLSKFSPD